MVMKLCINERVPEIKYKTSNRSVSNICIVGQTFYTPGILTHETGAGRSNAGKICHHVVNFNSHELRNGYSKCVFSYFCLLNVQTF